MAHHDVILTSLGKNTDKEGKTPEGYQCAGVFNSITIEPRNISIIYNLPFSVFGPPLQILNNTVHHPPQQYISNGFIRKGQNCEWIRRICDGWDGWFAVLLGILSGGPNPEKGKL